MLRKAASAQIQPQYHKHLIHLLPRSSLQFSHSTLFTDSPNKNILNVLKGSHLSEMESTGKAAVPCALAEQLTLTGVLVFSTFSFPSRSLELFFVDVERSLSLLSLMWSRSFSLFLSFLFRLC